MRGQYNFILFIPEKNPNSLGEGGGKNAQYIIICGK